MMHQASVQRQSPGPEPASRGWRRGKLPSGNGALPRRTIEGKPSRVADRMEEGRQLRRAVLGIHCENRLPVGFSPRERSFRQPMTQRAGPGRPEGVD